MLGDPFAGHELLEQRKLKATEQETTQVRQAEGEARAAAKPASKPAKADQK